MTSDDDLVPITREEFFANARRLGEANNDATGEKYVMWLMNGITPCIEDLATGKAWTLEWAQMVDMARVEFNKPIIITDGKMGAANG